MSEQHAEDLPAFRALCEELRTRSPNAGDVIKSAAWRMAYLLRNAQDGNKTPEALTMATHTALLLIAWADEGLHTLHASRHTDDEEGAHHA